MRDDMCQSDKSFFDIVKKWTINDYKTPKIKAEVIIDMLISEFLAETVEASGLPGNGKSILVTKEFPIRGYKKRKDFEYISTEINNSPSVDYLIKKGDVLYLTELKTDPLSFSEKQLIRMLIAKEHGINDLYQHYTEILDSTKHCTKYDFQSGQVADNIGSSQWNKCIKSIEILYVELKANHISSLDHNQQFKIYKADNKNNSEEVEYVFDGVLSELKENGRGLRVSSYNSNGIKKNIYIMSLDKIELPNNTLWNDIKKEILEECVIDKAEDNQE